MEKSSKDFLYKYLNNESPTGFESSGQKIWMDYMKPYVDSFITDTYGVYDCVLVFLACPLLCHLCLFIALKKELKICKTSRLIKSQKEALLSVL